ncbi:MAG TPA: hypothetical protein VLM90_15205 [Candidatus Deferrimicrobium sp.]|nr:hypothetical protein [Candidatus Deferrimicrobium sp.]
MKFRSWLIAHGLYFRHVLAPLIGAATLSRTSCTRVHLRLDVGETPLA